jgi:uncharacterized alpha-E superfamily protein
MLSRHAENLFWIGRYIERAEDTSRLLDVTHHGVLEAGSERTAEEVWSEALEMLMLEDEGIEIVADQVGERLIADRAEPGSLVSTVARARENALASREWLSSEVFEAINSLHISFLTTDLVVSARDRPYEVLRSIKTSCQAINGSVDSAMPRGEGYRFFLVGQQLERALITSRVLRVWHRRLGRVATHAAFSEWVLLLRTVSAYEAYLRLHRASMAESQVLSFLVQYPDFPRSVHHCLGRTETLLGELATDGIGARVRRQSGLLRSTVEYTELGSLGRSGLDEFLATIERGLLDLAESVELTYFRPTGPVFLHSYEAF